MIDPMDSDGPMFVPNPRVVKDPLERELAIWVQEARSRLWSLEEQIELLKKWNASWDEVIETNEP
jgi:hypothetical protein